MDFIINIMFLEIINNKTAAYLRSCEQNEYWCSVSVQSLRVVVLTVLERSVWSFRSLWGWPPDVIWGSVTAATSTLASRFSSGFCSLVTQPKYSIYWPKLWGLMKNPSVWLRLGTDHNEESSEHSCFLFSTLLNVLFIGTSFTMYRYGLELSPVSSCISCCFSVAGTEVITVWSAFFILPLRFWLQVMISKVCLLLSGGLNRIQEGWLLLEQ